MKEKILLLLFVLVASAWGGYELKKTLALN